MQEYTHKCIKCSELYKDKDPDPYYCPPCNEERKRIAQNIDTKLKDRVPTRSGQSGIQAYESLPKVKGFVSARDLHNLGLL